MDYLTRAIKRLRPTAEFSFNDEDYSTIKWDVIEGSAPTAKAIDDEIAKIKAEDLAAESAKAAAAASAVTKLEAIGLTAEEIAALRA